MPVPIGILLAALLAGQSISASAVSVSNQRNTYRAEHALVFLHVNVLPMDRERVLPNQCVVVSNGLIREIGSAEEVRIPIGAQRIEARGKYLIPGLIDSYTHVDGIFTLVPFLANGVTTVRNTAGGFPRHLGIRDRVNRGQLVGPRILTTGWRY